MTNFERMMQCKSAEDLAYTYKRLHQYEIYANGKLMNSTPANFLEWLNKESDDLDDKLFETKLINCPRCGAIPKLIHTENDTYSES